MTLEELNDTLMFNRHVVYVLIVLMAVQLVADIIVFRLAIAILRKAQLYLDLAAKHGKQTDERAERVERKLVDANVASGVLPPEIVPPEARRNGGCSPAVLAPLTAVLLLIGWNHNRAEAAQEMRAVNEAKALAWWAAERSDNPLPGS